MGAAAARLFRRRGGFFLSATSGAFRLSSPFCAPMAPGFFLNGTAVKTAERMADRYRSGPPSRGVRRGQVHTVETEKGLFAHFGAFRSIAMIAGTLLFVSLVPFFGSILLLISPLPVVYYWTVHERSQGISILLTSLLLVSLVELWVEGNNLPILFMIVLSGVLIAEVLKRGLSLTRSVVTASGALFLSAIAFLGYGSAKADVSPWQRMEHYVAALIQENIRIYSQLNIAEEQLLLIKENAAQITDVFTAISPALALTGAILTVCLNMIAVQGLLRRAGSPLANFGDLTLWRAPERLIWVLIAGGAMVLVAQGLPVVLGMNLLILCGLLYLFQGLAIVVYFFRRKGIPPFFRWLIYVLIVIQQYMLIFIIALGLFDLWVDFRKRMSETEDEPV